jgi:hypothetical protein
MTQLQQGFTIGGMGSDCHFAWQQPSGPNVRFGSKADIEAGPRDVRFAPKSGNVERRRQVRSMRSADMEASVGYDW